MNPPRPQHRAATLLVLGAFIAACGTTVARTAPPSVDSFSGGSGPAGPAGSTTVASLPTAGSDGLSGPGVAVTTGGSRTGTAGGATPLTAAPTANTSPLTVGLTYVDNSSSQASLGVSASSSVNAKAAAEAIVRGINAGGGVDGRKLTAIEHRFNSNGDNYSTDAAAACATFTQDHHVTVVLDNAFGITGGFRDCLQKAGVLDITTQDEGDRSGSEQAPLHANTIEMTADRTYSAVLTQMSATGYLGRSNQLGIIVESCPDDTAAYSHTLLPLIAHLGLKKPKDTQIDCTTGFSSAGPAAAGISNSILAFRQAGVDRVMFVSYYESVVLLLFASDAASQGYNPGYLLSSNAQAQGVRSNIPSGQWPQLHGVGNSPLSDVDGARPTAVDSRCLRLAAAGGVTPQTYQDAGVIIFGCGPFLLLEAALARTNGDGTAHALASAVGGLGTTFVAPGVVGSSTEFTTSRHDGPAAVQVFGYVASCSCMRYSGPAQPAPP